MRTKAIIIVALIAAVAGAIYLKERPEATQAKANEATASDRQAADSEKQQPRLSIPRLVDLGAGKCIPCKMMAPILEELKKEFVGKFEVTFIDVWKDKEAAKQYGIRLIPTQVFYDANGKEIFRHQGFFSREDILKTWKEHGLDFGE
ncbi:thioredoxin family protein [bacterium]|nr:thioredoxin family protein [bacterium]